MKISKKIIENLKEGGVDFYLSVPCKLLANMIDILEKDKEIYYLNKHLHKFPYLLPHVVQQNNKLLYLFQEYQSC